MNCQNSKFNERIQYKSRIYGTQINYDYCSNAFYCLINCRDFDWEGYHQMYCHGLLDIFPKLTVSQLDDEMNLIGNGSFGIIQFCNKKINKNLAYRELKIHKQLRHKYIIQLLQYVEKDDHIYLILEYAKNGHLTTNMQIDQNRQYFNNVMHYNTFIKNELSIETQNQQMCYQMPIIMLNYVILVQLLIKI